MTKLCRDCKHHKGHKLHYTFDICMSPHLESEINPVTGEKKPNYCFMERIYDDSCGEDGRYFQPKDRTIVEEPEKPKTFWNNMFGN